MHAPGVSKPCLTHPFSCAIPIQGRSVFVASLPHFLLINHQTYVSRAMLFPFICYCMMLLFHLAAAVLAVQGPSAAVSQSRGAAAAAAAAEFLNSALQQLLRQCPFDLPGMSTSLDWGRTILTAKTS